MNTSYLGGDWYIDQMKTAANEAQGVPFSLPKHKYTYMNDWVPIREVIDRAVDIREVVEFIRNEDPASQIKLIDGTYADYIPTRRLAIPVNKENVIASGIVAERDYDKMVDTVYMELRGSSIDKNQLMLIDMLANFDWKRPIYLTQVYILQDFGLMDYLQFDGYAYRLVPIKTPVKSVWDIGRIDPDYAAPLLSEKFRYGNLKDPDVYVDYFIQYNLGASNARSAFARVAKALMEEGHVAEGVALLDKGLEELPSSQIRFTDSNTFPFLEAYYAAAALGDQTAAEKGDALMRAYFRNLVEYIEYYLQFDGEKGKDVEDIIHTKLDELERLYYLSAYYNREPVVYEFNKYYRTLGARDDELILTQREKDSLNIQTDNNQQ
jgi:hypothetical protein